MGLFRRPVQTDLGTKMTTEIKEMKPRATAVAVSLGWLFSAVDITLLILFQSEIAEALAVPDQTIKIAIGVGLLGSALGGFVFAPLGDRFGRVRALGWAIILYSVATAGMAFSNDCDADGTAFSCRRGHGRGVVYRFCAAHRGLVV